MKKLAANYESVSMIQKLQMYLMNEYFRTKRALKKVKQKHTVQ